jgi:uncharacterized protein (DUF924 family)
MRDTKREILKFWFEDTEPSLWFQKNAAFDWEIKERFLTSYNMARQGFCEDWQKSADGCLALCILLDQFPRNMFRGQAQAFDTDEQALQVAHHAVARGFDQVLEPVQRRFIYLPYEHSEDLADQEKSCALFAKMKDEDPLGYDYAVKHLEVIKRFGRFPGRNKALKRDSTAEEEEYLASNDNGF